MCGVAPGCTGKGCRSRNSRVRPLCRYLKSGMRPMPSCGRLSGVEPFRAISSSCPVRPGLSVFLHSTRNRLRGQPGPLPDPIEDASREAYTLAAAFHTGAFRISKCWDYIRTTDWGPASSWTVIGHPVSHGSRTVPPWEPRALPHRVRSGAYGRFGIFLEPGTYDLETHAESGDAAWPGIVTVPDSDGTVIGTLELYRTGRVVLGSVVVV